jgi:hypothetical protein
MWRDNFTHQQPSQWRTRHATARFLTPAYEWFPVQLPQGFGMTTTATTNPQIVQIGQIQTATATATAKTG